MKHHKLTPVELAKDRKESNLGAAFRDAVGPVPEITDEKRWDALRGITYLASRNGWPAGDVREVVLALGLVGVEERTEELEPVERAAVLAALPFPDRVVRCPDCNALPGVPCTVRDGSRAYTPGHIARHRKAEERS